MFGRKVHFDLRWSLIFGGLKQLEHPDWKQDPNTCFRKPRNIWFDTSHDLFSLILYLDFRRSLIYGGQIPSESSMVKKETSE